MLQALEHWHKTFEMDAIVCSPPAGPAIGAVRIHARRRPIVPMKTLIEQTIADLKAHGVMDITVGPLERLTTVEQELGAVVTLFGRTFDGVIERTIGVAYGDESYLHIDGHVADTTHFQQFREAVYELTYYYPQGLGSKRSRRFEYTPPAGWQGLSRDRATEWYPLDYPKNWASITIHPATSLNQNPDAATLYMLVNDTNLSNFVADREQERTSVVVDKLKGTRVKTSGKYPRSEHLTYIAVVMEDGVYRYILRLESGDAFAVENEKAFDELVSTCKALPAPTADETGSALIHWVE